MAFGAFGGNVLGLLGVALLAGMIGVIFGKFVVLLAICCFGAKTRVRKMCKIHRFSGKFRRN